MLLNNQWINEQIKIDIKEYMGTNDKNNIKSQLLWDTAKAVLRRKYIAIQAYLKKEEQSQMGKSNITIMETGKRRTNET